MRLPGTPRLGLPRIWQDLTAESWGHQGSRGHQALVSPGCPGEPISPGHQGIPRGNRSFFPTCEMRSYEIRCAPTRGHYKMRIAKCAAMKCGLEMRLYKMRCYEMRAEMRLFKMRLSEKRQKCAVTTKCAVGAAVVTGQTFRRGQPVYLLTGPCEHPEPGEVGVPSGLQGQSNQRQISQKNRQPILPSEPSPFSCTLAARVFFGGMPHGAARTERRTRRK